MRSPDYLRSELVGWYCPKVYSQLGVSVSVVPVNKIGDRTRIKQALLFGLAMEVLKLTTMVDESGYLHLNIPTQLAATEVNVVVVVNPVAPDAKLQPSYDFSDLVGRLTWRGDAVTEQRTLRNEW
jgi:hypothetical protein